jgi:subtilisin family serine protease
LDAPRGKRHLIVLMRPTTARAAAPGAQRRTSRKAAAPMQPSLSNILSSFGASMARMFPAGQAGMRAKGARRAAAPGPRAKPSEYHSVAAKDAQLEQIAKELRNVPAVEAAYVKPAPEPAVNRMRASGPTPPAARTPNFTPRQDYLAAAPGGIDAHYAWTLAGGRGNGVTIIDVEGEWRTSHEDLTVNNNGVLGGTVPGDIGWRNHGTAVVGTCIGANNNLGIIGICADAKLGMISIFGDEQRTSSMAIREAADKLNAGDILLIELHYPGPKNNYEERDDQDGYIAVEWWPDEFDAIEYAVGRGVIVVEAAGNGAQDLDDNLYETPDPGFPATWKNPFRRTNRDSGAILVGAGAPPQGTHGRTLYGLDRSRLDFSNYGSAVDAQGWGREVTTLGYGDLQSGSDESRWYTDEFAGTSSASPIVVGALACLQGIRRAQGVAPLTPSQMRAALRATGSPQQADTNAPLTQRIGNRPDLKALVAATASLAAASGSPSPVSTGSDPT